MEEKENHFKKLRFIAEQIFFGKNIEEKLISNEQFANIVPSLKIPRVDGIFQKPNRSNLLQFSEKKIKFPSSKNLNSNLNRALTLHSFANHELMAIELMAYALLNFSFSEKGEQNLDVGIYSALVDEQKHLQLYINRINDLGYQFGDFPLNDFLWKNCSRAKNLSEFMSLVALTFESANLDFSYFYATIFRELGDEVTAKVMDIIYLDEIKHVKIGMKYLSKKAVSENCALWKYYQNNLPIPMTPARSKGLNYQRLHRERVGFDNDFILELEKYDDHFPVTKRK